MIAPLGCDVDNPAVLLERAELALGLARRFGDLNLEAKALADGGLARVRLGRIDEGMAWLKAMALVCGPADDTEVASRTVCSFFTACYDAADLGRAGSWTAMLDRQGVIGSRPGSASCPSRTR